MSRWWLSSRQRQFRRNQTAAVQELGAAQQKEKEKEHETQT
jgi:hypothetical protein